MRSFGFCDVGVKKLATAPLEMALCVFRLTGGGEMGLPDAFRLLVELPPLLVLLLVSGAGGFAMLWRCELAVAMRRMQIGGKGKCLGVVNRSGREE